MLKIALFSEVFPPQHGGSGRWFSEMYPRMQGVDVRYLVGEHPDAEALDKVRRWNVERWQMGWHFYGVEHFRHTWRHWTGSRRLRRWLKRNPVDQLHAGRPLSEGFIAAMACPRRTKLVCYIHGEDVSVAKTSRQLQWITNWTLGRCDQLIVNSNNTQRMLIEDWGVLQAKIALLHPGVDCQHFAPADGRSAVRQRLGWGDRPVVLTVGRLQRRKGQDTALHAVAALREQFPDILWVFVGDGADRQMLHELAVELGVTESVHFLHDADDQQLQQYYVAADLFVLPNRTVGNDVEGFGMVLLEAQACGLPAIAGKSGGTVDAVNNSACGAIVDCSDVKHPQALISSVAKILMADVPQRTALSISAANWAKQFNWDLVADRGKEIFTALENTNKVL